MQKPKKRGITKIIILMPVIILVIPICAVLGMKVYYSGFFANPVLDARRELLIPGLNDGFIPQGLYYAAEQDMSLFSGYGNRDKEAVVYAVGTDGTVHGNVLYDTNGSMFINHAGGVAAHGEYVYIAGCDGMVYAAIFSDMLDNSGTAAIIGSVEAANNADFCTVYNGKLYAGEFFYGLKYQTNANHRIITPSGDENRAIVTVFELDAREPLGVNSNPVYAISVPDRVQGMCFDEGSRMILSVSVLFSPSKLYYYDTQAMMLTARTFTVNGCDIPLYFADGGHRVKTIELPPKAEGITARNNRLYFVNEAASKRFVFGRFLGLNYVYSIKN